MSADLTLRDAAAPTSSDSDLQFRWENTVNTPISSATYLDDGRAIADDYTLTFTNTGTPTVTVDCSSKNPYRDMTGTKTVTADGSTANTEIIPGVSIVLNSGLSTGWEAKVSIGDLMGASGGTTSRLVFGVVESGSTTTSRRIACVNVGSDDASSVSVKGLPGFWYTGDTSFIESIDNHSSSAREGLASAGTKTITFANWADGTGAALGYKVADVLVGGVTAITTAIFDGSTVYEYGAGNGYDDTADLLRGLQLVLPLTTSDPSSASITLTISDGDDWLELAEDVSGSPGTFGSGPLTLTEPGESSGIITVSGIAYFHARLTLPTSATTGAIRSFRVSVSGLSI